MEAATVFHQAAALLQKTHAPFLKQAREAVALASHVDDMWGSLRTATVIPPGPEHEQTQAASDKQHREKIVALRKQILASRRELSRLSMLADVDQCLASEARLADALPILQAYEREFIEESQPGAAYQRRMGALERHVTAALHRLLTVSADGISWNRPQFLGRIEDLQQHVDRLRVTAERLGAWTPYVEQLQRILSERILTPIAHGRKVATIDSSTNSARQVSFTAVAIPVPPTLVAVVSSLSCVEECVAPLLGREVVADLLADFLLAGTAVPASLEEMTATCRTMWQRPETAASPSSVLAMVSEARFHETWLLARQSRLVSAVRSAVLVEAAGVVSGDAAARPPGAFVSEETIVDAFSALLDANRGARPSNRVHIHRSIRMAVELLLVLAEGQQMSPLGKPLLTFVRGQAFLADFLVRIAHFNQKLADAQRSRLVGRVDEWFRASCSFVSNGLRERDDPLLLAEASCSSLDVGLAAQMKPVLSDEPAQEYVLKSVLNALFARESIGSGECDALQMLMGHLMQTLPICREEKSRPTVVLFRSVHRILGCNMTQVREYVSSGELGPAAVSKDRLCGLVEALFQDNTKRKALLRFILDFVPPS